MAEAMQRARHVACRMESLGVCTLQCLPDGKLWNKDSLYTVGAELCWAALQSWYSPGEEEQVNELGFFVATVLILTLSLSEILWIRCISFF